MRWQTEGIVVLKIDMNNILTELQSLKSLESHLADGSRVAITLLNLFTHEISSSYAEIMSL